MGKRTVEETVAAVTDSARRLVTGEAAGRRSLPHETVVFVTDDLELGINVDANGDRVMMPDDTPVFVGIGAWDTLEEYGILDRETISHFSRRTPANQFMVLADVGGGGSDDFVFGRLDIGRTVRSPKENDVMNIRKRIEIWNHLSAQAGWLKRTFGWDHLNPDKILLLIDSADESQQRLIGILEGIVSTGVPGQPRLLVCCMDRNIMKLILGISGYSEVSQAINDMPPRIYEVVVAAFGEATVFFS
ncbi:hypothetical protein JW899_04905 [Candidatus Uhrbacteria bacterium]|nr:hypothetical protein [Candidatus Uhrbacteria bacterium]